VGGVGSRTKSKGFIGEWRSSRCGDGGGKSFDSGNGGWASVLKSGKTGSV
jgi:hypothetical protein